MSAAKPRSVYYRITTFRPHTRAARPAGRLLMIVKSAHVYESERAYLRDVLEAYR
jgi:hypothetical protein